MKFKIIRSILSKTPQPILAFFRKPMPARKVCHICIVSFVVFMTLAAAATIILDPCQRYPWKIVPPLYIMDYETIPGLLRNDGTYDAVIIGSSTSQNFNLADFRREMNVNPIKATASGCYWATGKVFFDLADKSRGSQLTEVVQSLEMPAFFKGKDQHKTPLPMFLYDSFSLNDAQYWWNFDIWNEYLKNLNRILFKSVSDWRSYQNPDLMFAGDFKEDLEKHGLKQIRRAMRKNSFGAEPFRKEDSLLFEESFRKNILSSVKKRPDIKFVFYFPPYSIYYLISANDSGMLEYALEAREKIATQLLKEPNVMLYDFQSDEEIVANPDNYKDMIHFTPAINRSMVHSFAQSAPATSSDRVASVASIRENNDGIRKLVKKLYCPH